MFKATAIISAYNSSEFIRHKIQNIRESVTPVKIIIIDCTGGYELNLVKDLMDDNISGIIIENRISIWEAMNIGIKANDTPYVVQANTDDHVHPLAYDEQINKLDDGYDIAYFDYYQCDGYYLTYGRRRLSRQTLPEGQIPF